MKLYLDLETYNETDIKLGGAKYSETVEVIIATYAFDDEPVEVWDKLTRRRMPKRLRDALNDDSVEIVIHNGLKFDRLQLAADPEIAIVVKPERVIDQMVMGFMHALPGKLDMQCDALGVPDDFSKDKRGKKLINTFCKPLGKSSRWRKHGFTRNLDLLKEKDCDWPKRADQKYLHQLRDDYDYFKGTYATLDVVAMRECYYRCPKWNATTRELKLLNLDTTINDRGVMLDEALIDGALAAIAEEQHYLKQRALQITDGAFHTNQVAKFRKYLQKELDITLPGVGAEILDNILATHRNLDPFVKELIEVRLAASSSSTAKYKVMKAARMEDGRVRGMLQFAGAMRTARWAGRIIQPQNFPRPVLKEWIMATVIDMLRDMRSRRARKMLASTMDVCTSALRGCIISPPEKILRVADLSNIEGRGLAWLAGEEWKLEAFRAYDNGTGPDLYKLAYAKAFNMRPEDVTELQRQIGKVMELGLGYGGGVGAFMQFAKAYRLDLYELADIALDNDLIPTKIWRAAHKFWHNPKFASGHKRLCKENKITKREWMVCDCLKRMWREAHPATVKFWYDCETAARMAIEYPGEWFEAGEHIAFQMTKRGWLRMQLPSGRFICYPDASIRMSRKHHDEDKEDDDDEGDSRITYMGMYKSAKWLRLHTYSGKLAENATQAVARDVLAHNMPFIERRGYEIILSVHDELLTETPDDDRYSHKELEKLMSRNPPWARKLPLNAEGFSDYRYRK